MLVLEEKAIWIINSTLYLLHTIQLYIYNLQTYINGYQICLLLTTKPYQNKIGYQVASVSGMTEEVLCALAEDPPSSGTVVAG